MSGSGARAYRIDGGFTVDVARRFVRGPDSELHLRAKTFTVLEVLIENRHRMLSKEELLSAVWGATAVTDDVLVTSITEIRRAFGDDPRSPQFIKTIHRTGYRWIAAVEEIGAGAESVPQVAPPSGTHRLTKPAAIAAALLVLGSAGALSSRIWRQPVEHESEVGWWRFDETSGDAISDSSGRGNSGRILSGAERVPGRLGGALRFNGLGDAVTGRTGSSIPMGNTPRSIALWIKTDSTNGDFTSLLYYGVPGLQPPGASFGLALTPDGRVQVGGDQVRGKSHIADGAWHSVAAVYDGPPSHLARVYIDGSEEAGGPLNPPPATINGGVWSIGKFLGPGTRFRGVMDDVRVFNRALRPAEVQALFRCGSGMEDLAGADGAFYYLPVMISVPSINGGEIVNSGKDIGGIQFARGDRTCSAASLEGASVGQDVYLSAELKTPGANGFLTEAGLYFRSRKAHAGDGIAGGTSAGYVVQLRTGGQVSVKCLNPGRVIAYTNNPGLASDAYHRLEVVAVGATLQASVDGKLLEFDQGGRLTTAVSIPPSWEGPPKVGHNDGTAGVVFTADLNRGQLGGQAARNVIIRPAAKLFSSR